MPGSTFSAVVFKNSLKDIVAVMQMAKIDTSLSIETTCRSEKPDNGVDIGLFSLLLMYTIIYPIEKGKNKQIEKISVIYEK